MSTRAQSARGRQREVDVAELLWTRGWDARRCSKGVVDVIAAKGHGYAWPIGHHMEERWVLDHSLAYIQVKSTKMPWERFGPVDRKEFLEAAERAGAEPWLCHWPADRKPPRWIHGDLFPKSRET